MIQGRAVLSLFRCVGGCCCLLVQAMLLLLHATARSALQYFHGKAELTRRSSLAQSDIVQSIATLIVLAARSSRHTHNSVQVLCCAVAPLQV
jgi:hypothetical protein